MHANAKSNSLNFQYEFEPIFTTFPTKTLAIHNGIIPKKMRCKHHYEKESFLVLVIHTWELLHWIAKGMRLVSVLASPTHNLTNVTPASKSSGKTSPRQTRCLNRSWTNWEKKPGKTKEVLDAQWVKKNFLILHGSTLPLKLPLLQSPNIICWLINRF